MKTTLGASMCEALVDGWVADWKMGRVVTHAWILFDEDPDDLRDKFAKCESALKVNHIDACATAKVWIARHLPQLNEALWAGRKRDAAISVAKKEVGIGSRTRIADIAVSARAGDKRHDWGTVK